MASLHQHPSAMPPMAVVASLLAKFDRGQLSDVIESAIARLDRMDPDPELEDSEGGGHLIDAKGRWLGDDWTASQFDENREPDDEDMEHDGQEEDDGH